MPGRTFQAANTSAYRFGFNDKENDRGGSWSSTQLVQDYGARLYNPAIGKFLSVDPIAKEYPWNSPYAFAENDVISSIDIDGEEKYRITIRAFIPWEKVILEPVNIATMFVNREYAVHGEGRFEAAYDLSKLGYDEKVPGKEGYRVEYQFDIDVDAQQNIDTKDVKSKAGLTTVYRKLIIDPKTAKYEELWSGYAENGKDNKFSLLVTKNETNGDLKKVDLNFKIDARFPYHDLPFTLFPAIDANIFINIDKNIKDNSVKLSGIALLDGFPAIEGFIERVDKPSEPINFLFWKPSSPNDGVNLMPVIGDRFEDIKPTELPSNKKQ